MKYMLFYTALMFAIDTQLGEPTMLYSALYTSIFLYIQQRTDGFAYVVAPQDMQTVNPATGLPMQQQGASYGYDVGGHPYGFND